MPLHLLSDTMRSIYPHFVMIRKLVATISAISMLGAYAPIVMAQQSSFSDVPADSEIAPAVEFLKATEIISGYEDGTFRPNQKVNRAEAVKIIVAPLLTKEQLAQATQTVYNDVPTDAWYLPYIEWARQAFGILDGPPEKPSFNGAQPVVKVEFLKMLLLANKVDPNSFSEISLPLADDVTNTNEWFYPYMRYAMTSSMIMIGEDGKLNPGAELTRGDVALLMFRFLMYQDNRRTQALLSETEQEIVIVLNSLESNNITQAEYASARGLLAARGAHASRPDTGVVKGALKIAEAFRALVRAYRAGLNLQLDEVIKLAGDAWTLSEQAKSMSPDVEAISTQVQASAKTMADSARELKTQVEQTKQ